MKHPSTCHSERSEEFRNLSTWQAWRFLTSFGMTLVIYSFLHTLQSAQADFVGVARVFRRRATLATLPVIGSFLRNRHVVGVALAQARARYAYEAGVLLERFDVR